jgi:AraC-like DNA-binding protein
MAPRFRRADFVFQLNQCDRSSAELIERSEQPLVNIAVHMGFADQAHFSRSFHARVGLTPSQFRRAHR